MEMSISGSQMLDVTAVSHVSLLAECRRRITSKSKIPMWQLAAMQAQRFWACHMANPVLHVRLGESTFHRGLAEAGVHDKPSLKRYMLSQRKLSQRCNWLKRLWSTACYACILRSLWRKWAHAPHVLALGQRFNSSRTS
eukprot:5764226-Amphidinium_carterae.1